MTYLWAHAEMTLLGAILIAAAITDLRSQRIPNLLTLPMILAALLFHGVASGASGLLFSCLGAAAGIALLLPPYLMGGMGAGDAKLMGAVGAVTGAKGVFIAFLFTALFGGLYAVALLVIRRRCFNGFLKERLLALQVFLFTRQYTPAAPNAQADAARPKLCYGLAIAAGSILYIFLKLGGYAFPVFGA